VTDSAKSPQGVRFRRAGVPLLAAHTGKRMKAVPIGRPFAAIAPVQGNEAHALGTVPSGRWRAAPASSRASPARRCTAKREPVDAGDVPRPSTRWRARDARDCRHGGERRQHQARRAGESLHRSASRSMRATCRAPRRGGALATPATAGMVASGASIKPGEPGEALHRDNIPSSRLTSAGRNHP
jgi:hypothetical protein